MLSGNPPWHGLEGVAAIYAIATSKKPKYQLPDDASDMAQDFLKCCFVRNPLRRPYASELLRDRFVCDVV